MTIAIAALATISFQQRIVVCSDWLVGDGLSSIEHDDKIYLQFPGRLVALWSGTLADVNDLLRICHSKITGEDDLDTLRAGLHSSVKELTSSLRKRGRKTTDAELIVTGFVGNRAVLISVNQNGVYDLPSFHAIGSGAMYADPILRWRATVQLDPISNIHDVMYRVFEAKRFAETCDSVGGRTTMIIISPVDNGIRFHHLTDSALEFLDGEVQKYGPQFLPQKRENIRDFPDVIT